MGPDAVPFLEWRRKMTDEEWVNLSGGDDETWYRGLERDFGLDSGPEIAGCCGSTGTTGQGQVATIPDSRS